MAKKKRRKIIYRDVIHTDPFTVQFTALSVILLAFFILLNSMAVLDQQKVQLALASLVGNFGSVPFGEADPSQGMMDTPSIEPSSSQLAAITRHLAAMVESEGLRGAVSVFTRGDDVVFEIQGDAVFQPGLDDYTENARVVIKGVAKVVENFQSEIMLIGHTDAVSTFATRYRTNWEFAVARSARIYTSLLELGLDADDIAVASRGHVDPIRPNETFEQQRANRRFEVMVVDGVYDPFFQDLLRTRAPEPVTVEGLEVEHPDVQER